MAFFPPLKNIGSLDSLGQIRGQSECQTVIGPKLAYSGNFLTEIESLGNFFQNDTKFG